jgi:hypothetical protein
MKTFSLPNISYRHLNADLNNRQLMKHALVKESEASIAEAEIYQAIRPLRFTSESLKEVALVPKNASGNCPGTTLLHYSFGVNTFIPQLSSSDVPPRLVCLSHHFLVILSDLSGNFTDSLTYTL